MRQISNTIAKPGYLDEKGMANKPGSTMFAKVTRFDMDIDILIILAYNGHRFKKSNIKDKLSA